MTVFLIIHSYVRPFFISFRGGKAKTYSNAGIYRLPPIYSAEEDMRSLYEKAQIEDAEWFQRVLGGKAVASTETVTNVSNVKSDVVPDPNSPNKRINDPNSRISRNVNRAEERSPTFDREVSNPSQMSTKLGEDQMRSLFSLGYSPADVGAIKESVLHVLLESNVKRPRKGLPSSWMEAASSDLDQNVDQKRERLRPYQFRERCPG